MADMESKCVFVLDEALPTGVLLNATAMLGITLGKLNPEMVGEDVPDASGQIHPGIFTLPVPILKGNRQVLRELYEKANSGNFAALQAVDFSDVAQSCHQYEAYIEKVQMTHADDYAYLGIALYGPKKLVNKLTGNMALLR